MQNWSQTHLVRLLDRFFNCCHWWRYSPRYQLYRNKRLCFSHLTSTEIPSVLVSIFQTKGKPQTGSASDIQKFLSKSQIQDWRNSDFQKYKVRNQHRAAKNQGCLLCKSCCSWLCEDFIIQAVCVCACASLCVCNPKSPWCFKQTGS